MSYGSSTTRSTLVVHQSTPISRKLKSVRNQLNQPIPLDFEDESTLDSNNIPTQSVDQPKYSPKELFQRLLILSSNDEQLDASWIHASNNIVCQPLLFFLQQMVLVRRLEKPKLRKAGLNYFNVAPRFVLSMITSDLLREYIDMCSSKQASPLASALHIHVGRSHDVPRSPTHSYNDHRVVELIENSMHDHADEFMSTGESVEEFRVDDQAFLEQLDDGRIVSMGSTLEQLLYGISLPCAICRSGLALVPEVQSSVHRHYSNARRPSWKYPPSSIYQHFPYPDDNNQKDRPTFELDDFILHDSTLRSLVTTTPATAKARDPQSLDPGNIGDALNSLDSPSAKMDADSHRAKRPRHTAPIPAHDPTSQHIRSESLSIFTASVVALECGHVAHLHCAKNARINRQRMLKQYRGQAQRSVGSGKSNGKSGIPLGTGKKTHRNNMNDSSLWNAVWSSDENEGHHTGEDDDEDSNAIFQDDYSQDNGVSHSDNRDKNTLPTQMPKGEGILDPKAIFCLECFTHQHARRIYGLDIPLQLTTAFMHDIHPLFSRALVQAATFRWEIGCHPAPPAVKPPQSESTQITSLHDLLNDDDGEGRDVKSTGTNSSKSREIPTLPFIHTVIDVFSKINARTFGGISKDVHSNRRFRFASITPSLSHADHLTTEDYQNLNTIAAIVPWVSQHSVRSLSAFIQSNATPIVVDGRRYQRIQSTDALNALQLPAFVLVSNGDEIDGTIHPQTTSYVNLHLMLLALGLYTSRLVHDSLTEQAQQQRHPPVPVLPRVESSRMFDSDGLPSLPQMVDPISPRISYKAIEKMQLTLLTLQAELDQAESLYRNGKAELRRLSLLVSNLNRQVSTMVTFRLGLISSPELFTRALVNHVVTICQPQGGDNSSKLVDESSEQNKTQLLQVASSIQHELLLNPYAFRVHPYILPSSYTRFSRESFSPTPFDDDDIQQHSGSYLLGTKNDTTCENNAGDVLHSFGILLLLFFSCEHMTSQRDGRTASEHGPTGLPFPSSASDTQHSSHLWSGNSSFTDTFRPLASMLTSILEQQHHLSHQQQPSSQHSPLISAYTVCFHAIYEDFTVLHKQHPERAQQSSNFRQQGEAFPFPDGTNADTISPYGLYCLFMQCLISAIRYFRYLHRGIYGLKLLDRIVDTTLLQFKNQLQMAYSKFSSTSLKPNDERVKANNGKSHHRALTTTSALEQNSEQFFVFAVQNAGDIFNNLSIEMVLYAYISQLCHDMPNLSSDAAMPAPSPIARQQHGAKESIRSQQSLLNRFIHDSTRFSFAINHAKIIQLMSLKSPIEPTAGAIEKSVQKNTSSSFSANTINERDVDVNHSHTIKLHDQHKLNDLASTSSSSSSTSSSLTCPKTVSFHNPFAIGSGNSQLSQTKPETQLQLTAPIDPNSDIGTCTSSFHQAEPAIAPQEDSTSLIPLRKAHISIKGGHHVHQRSFSTHHDEADELRYRLNLHNVYVLNGCLSNASLPLRSSSALPSLDAIEVINSCEYLDIYGNTVLPEHQTTQGKGTLSHPPKSQEGQPKSQSKKKQKESSQEKSAQEGRTSQELTVTSFIRDIESDPMFLILLLKGQQHPPSKSHHNKDMTSTASSCSYTIVAPTFNVDQLVQYNSIEDFFHHRIDINNFSFASFSHKMANHHDFSISDHDHAALDQFRTGHCALLPHSAITSTFQFQTFLQCLKYHFRTHGDQHHQSSFIMPVKLSHEAESMTANITKSTLRVTTPHMIFTDYKTYAHLSQCSSIHPSHLVLMTYHRIQTMMHVLESCDNDQSQLDMSTLMHLFDDLGPTSKSDPLYLFYRPFYARNSYASAVPINSTPHVLSMEQNTPSSVKTFPFLNLNTSFLNEAFAKRPSTAATCLSGSRILNLYQHIPLSTRQTLDHSQYARYKACMPIFTRASKALSQSNVTAASNQQAGDNSSIVSEARPSSGVAQRRTSLDNYDDIDDEMIELLPASALDARIQTLSPQIKELEHAIAAKEQRLLQIDQQTITFIDTIIDDILDILTRHYNGDNMKIIQHFSGLHQHICSIHVGQPGGSSGEHSASSSALAAASTATGFKSHHGKDGESVIDILDPSFLHLGRQSMESKASTTTTTIVNAPHPQLSNQQPQGVEKNLTQQRTLSTSASYLRSSTGPDYSQELQSNQTRYSLSQSNQPPLQPQSQSIKRQGFRPALASRFTSDTRKPQVPANLAVSNPGTNPFAIGKKGLHSSTANASTPASSAPSGDPFKHSGLLPNTRTKSSFSTSSLGQSNSTIKNVHEQKDPEDNLDLLHRANQQSVPHVLAPSRLDIVKSKSAQNPLVTPHAENDHDSNDGGDDNDDGDATMIELDIASTPSPSNRSSGSDDDGNSDDEIDFIDKKGIPVKPTENIHNVPSSLHEDQETTVKVTQVEKCGIQQTVVSFPANPTRFKHASGSRLSMAGGVSTVDYLSLLTSSDTSPVSSHGVDSDSLGISDDDVLIISTPYRSKTTKTRFGLPHHAKDDDHMSLHRNAKKTKEKKQSKKEKESKHDKKTKHKKHDKKHSRSDNNENLDRVSHKEVKSQQPTTVGKGDREANHHSDRNHDQLISEQQKDELYDSHRVHLLSSSMKRHHSTSDKKNARLEHSHSRTEKTPSTSTSTSGKKSNILALFRPVSSRLQTPFDTPSKSAENGRKTHGGSSGSDDDIILLPTPQGANKATVKGIKGSNGARQKPTTGQNSDDNDDDIILLD